MDPRLDKEFRAFWEKNLSLYPELGGYKSALLDTNTPWNDAMLLGAWNHLKRLNDAKVKSVQRQNLGTVVTRDHLFDPIGRTDYPGAPGLSSGIREGVLPPKGPALHEFGKDAVDGVSLPTLRGLPSERATRFGAGIPAPDQRIVPPKTTWETIDTSFSRPSMPPAEILSESRGLPPSELPGGRVNVPMTIGPLPFTPAINRKLALQDPSSWGGLGTDTPSTMKALAAAGVIPQVPYTATASPAYRPITRPMPYGSTEYPRVKQADEISKFKTDVGIGPALSQAMAQPYTGSAPMSEKLILPTLAATGNFINQGIESILSPDPDIRRRFRELVEMEPDPNKWHRILNSIQDQPDGVNAPNVLKDLVTLFEPWLRPSYYTPAVRQAQEAGEITSGQRIVSEIIAEVPFELVAWGAIRGVKGVAAWQKAASNALAEGKAIPPLQVTEWKSAYSRSRGQELARTFDEKTGQWVPDETYTREVTLGELIAKRIMAQEARRQANIDAAQGSALIFDTETGTFKPSQEGITTPFVVPSGTQGLASSRVIVPSGPGEFEMPNIPSYPDPVIPGQSTLPPAQRKALTQTGEEVGEEGLEDVEQLTPYQQELLKPDAEGAFPTDAEIADITTSPKPIDHIFAKKQEHTGRAGTSLSEDELGVMKLHIQRGNITKLEFTPSNWDESMIPPELNIIDRDFMDRSSPNYNSNFSKAMFKAIYGSATGNFVWHQNNIRHGVRFVRRNWAGDNSADNFITKVTGEYHEGGLYGVDEFENIFKQRNPDLYQKLKSDGWTRLPSHAMADNMSEKELLLLLRYMYEEPAAFRHFLSDDKISWGRRSDPRVGEGAAITYSHPPSPIDKIIKRGAVGAPEFRPKLYGTFDPRWQFQERQQTLGPTPLFDVKEGTKGFGVSPELLQQPVRAAGRDSEWMIPLGKGPPTQTIDAKVTIADWTRYQEGQAPTVLYRQPGVSASETVDQFIQKYGFGWDPLEIKTYADYYKLVDANSKKLKDRSRYFILIDQNRIAESRAIKVTDHRNPIILESLSADELKQIREIQKAYEAVPVREYERTGEESIVTPMTEGTVDVQQAPYGTRASRLPSAPTTKEYGVDTLTQVGENLTYKMRVVPRSQAMNTRRVYPGKIGDPSVTGKSVWSHELEKTVYVAQEYGNTLRMQVDQSTGNIVTVGELPKGKASIRNRIKLESLKKTRHHPAGARDWDSALDFIDAVPDKYLEDYRMSLFKGENVDMRGSFDMHRGLLSIWSNSRKSLQGTWEEFEYALRDPNANVNEIKLAYEKTFTEVMVHELFHGLHPFISDADHKLLIRAYQRHYNDPETRKTLLRKAQLYQEKMATRQAPSDLAAPGKGRDPRAAYPFSDRNMYQTDDYLEWFAVVMTDKQLYETFISKTPEVIGVVNKAKTMAKEMAQAFKNILIDIRDEFNLKIRGQRFQARGRTRRDILKDEELINRIYKNIMEGKYTTDKVTAGQMQIYTHVSPAASVDLEGLRSTRSYEGMDFAVPTMVDTRGVDIPPTPYSVTKGRDPIVDSIPWLPPRDVSGVPPDYRQQMGEISASDTRTRDQRWPLAHTALPQRTQAGIRYGESVDPTDWWRRMAMGDADLAIRRGAEDPPKGGPPEHIRNDPELMSDWQKENTPITFGTHSVLETKQKWIPRIRRQVPRSIARALGVEDPQYFKTVTDILDWGEDIPNMLQIVDSHAQALSTNVKRILIDSGAFKIKKSKEFGGNWIVEDVEFSESYKILQGPHLEGATPTIADILADPYHFKLTGEQVGAVNKYRNYIQDWHETRRAWNIQASYDKDAIDTGIGFREDVNTSSGGEYFPRGVAEELDKTDWWNRGVDHVATAFDVPSIRKGGGGASYRKPAIFGSQWEGIKAGYVYGDPFETIHQWGRSIGIDIVNINKQDRLLAWKDITDSQGKPLGITKKDLVKEVNPQLATQFQRLHEDLSNLQGIASRLDRKTMNQLEDFIYKDPWFDNIEEARSAAQHLIVLVSKGVYKGKNADGVRQIAKELKERLDKMKKEYDQEYGRILTKTDRGELQHTNLSRIVPRTASDRKDWSGMTFPNAVIDGINKVLKAEAGMPRHLRSFRNVERQGIQSIIDYPFIVATFNNMLHRALGATGDISHLGIQGLIVSARYPSLATKSVMMGARALNPIGKGREELWGAWEVQHDRKAIINGTPTVRELINDGVHIAGDRGEFLFSKSLENTPGIGFFLKLFNRVFAIAGDTMRIGLAENKWRDEIKSGRTINEIRQSGDNESMAHIVNSLTGFHTNRTFGNVGELLLFAPRFLQSRIDVAAKTAMGIGRIAIGKKTSLDQRIAMRDFMQFLGVASVGTVILNTMYQGMGYLTEGQVADTFNPIRIRNGRVEKNPNFLKVITPRGKVSLFGPWDSFAGLMILGTASAINRDPSQAFSAYRGMSSGSAVALWDQISGTDLFGRRVSPIHHPNDNDFVDWAAKFYAPFAGEEMYQGVRTARTGVKERDPWDIAAGLSEAALEFGGIKWTPMSLSGEKIAAESSYLESLGIHNVGDFLDHPLGEAYKDAPAFADVDKTQAIDRLYQLPPRARLIIEKDMQGDPEFVQIMEEIEDAPSTNRSAYYDMQDELRDQLAKNLTEDFNLSKADDSKHSMKNYRIYRRKTLEDYYRNVQRNRDEALAKGHIVEHEAKGEFAIALDIHDRVMFTEDKEFIIEHTGSYDVMETRQEFNFDERERREKALKEKYGDAFIDDISRARMERKYPEGHPERDYYMAQRHIEASGYYEASSYAADQMGEEAIEFWDRYTSATSQEQRNMREAYETKDLYKRIINDATYLRRMVRNADPELEKYLQKLGYVMSDIGDIDIRRTKPSGSFATY